MLCYKSQGNYAVCNELSSGTVGWVVARGTVGFVSFVVRTRKVFFFPLSSFSKFLSPVSFFRVRLSVRLSVRVRLGLALGLWLGLGFKPSSPIVRELVVSLTRLSFPLVRFGHNHFRLGGYK